MFRTATAYVCLAVWAVWLLAALYWGGLTVMGTPSYGNFGIAIVIAIVFGVLANRLHPNLPIRRRTS